MYHIKLLPKNWLFISFLLMLCLSFSTCDESEDPEEMTPLDISGSWELTTTVTSNTCGAATGAANTEVIYLTDTSGVLTIINFNGDWGTATIDGSKLNFVGSEISDAPGCLATLNTEGTGSISENQISGEFTTNVLFNPDSCEDLPDCIIISSFVMNKIEESSCSDRAIFGDPKNSEYVLPFPVGAAYPVYQSYCWPTGGHRDQLAYDFIIPISDTIVAARSGVVRGIREDSPDTGEGYGEHNYIFIQHEDGTVAFYAHLMQNKVMVEVDDIVNTGQPIALSGNSGQSGEPHLHFGVYQAYPPTEGLDIAVNFRNAEGPLDTRGSLIKGQNYQATSY
jgi:hypothetical protein